MLGHKPISCINCAHFHQYKEIALGWKDGKWSRTERDAVWGGCHAHAPKASWLTRRAVWPIVYTGQGCSEYKDAIVEYT